MAYQWWQCGVIYQIYPRSFQDASGDGVGDLAGVAARLDYCETLGVDAIWLSPIYPSPMADFGYDVADYIGVHPLFGSLADFDRLLGEVKRRGMKLLLDYVPNHSSDRHPWFIESRSSRTSMKRDWYLWRDAAADGGAPNNWLSHFGGSAWQWDDTTRQYYCHSFLKEQPDLNWRNPEVICAMHEVLRFWLRRGVDGFRIDVLWLLIKDDLFRDNPPNPDYRPGMPLFNSQLPVFTSDRPEMQAVVAGMRRVCDAFESRVLIGEIYLPLERLMTYYGPRLDGVHLPFNFQLLQSVWNARVIAQLIDRYEALLPRGGWPNWVLGNHDKSRIASRIGVAQSRVAAMLLLTLRGTPTLYYGDELSMHDVLIPADRVQDPLEKNVPGLGLGRDPCRTPMQWDGSAHAGFSTAEPWLPIAPDYTAVNVLVQSAEPTSMLEFCRRLLELRRANAALSTGSYEAIEASGDLLAYVRRCGTVRVLIVLNLGPNEGVLPLQSLCFNGEALLSTHGDRMGEDLGAELRLRGNEGVMMQLHG